MADERVREVLQELHMNALINTFSEEKVDLETLISCSDEELSRLGVTTIGDRIRLKDACRKKNRASLRTGWAPAAAATVNSTSSSSTTSSFAGAISNERSILFHPYNTSSSNNNRKKGKSGTKRRSGTKKKVDKYWTIPFLCLADTYSSRVPSNIEKQQLSKAGLGLRRIQLNLEDSEEEVIEKLSSDELSDERDPTSFVGFPQLKECGGFELMQCLPNSRDLAVIDSNLGAKLLKAKLGGSQGKVFIRPIQRSLSKKSICEDILSERKEECLYCKAEFPVRDLRKHLWSHRTLAAINPLFDDSSDSDSSTGSDILTRSPFVSAMENPPAELVRGGNMTDAIIINEEKEISHELNETLQNVEKTVENTLVQCEQNGLLSNPVEILRCLQNNFVCGRSLEITDPTECPEGDTNFILVDRCNVLKTVMEEIQNIDNLSLTLEVQFYDETAQDYGGPRKEFFRLILREIKEQYFENGEIKDHYKEEESAFLTIGVIFGLSVVQNGPIVQYISESLIQEIFQTGSTSHPSVRGLQAGLKKCCIHQISIAVPLFLRLFRPSNVKLTLKRLTSLLVPEFSENGTNSRKFENELYTQYLKYLREAASGRRGTITLNHILRFATCTDEEPKLGFTLQPSVKFVEPAVNSSFLPLARTCINSIMLPRPTLTNPLPENLFALYDYAFSNSYFGTT